VTPPAGGPVEVREIRWNDLTDLTESYYRLYDERAAGVPIGITLFARPPGYDEEVAWFAGVYRRALAGDLVVRVAEVDGHVVGNCMVGRVGPSAASEAGHVGELGILVHRDYRGRGIGGALLRATLDACRGTFEIVRLSVFSINTGAAALYRRFGFVPVGRIPAAVRRGSQYFDEDVMVLDLRAPAAKA
jgi:ribosomal protein S18 acetylase RimI-like enzyme